MKYRIEERLKRIVEEAQNDSAVIIVIDEIHSWCCAVAL
jgi:ATP-dependent Clp protease ATP-binding subunit ClpA